MSFAAAEASGATGAYGTKPYTMGGCWSVAREKLKPSAIVGDLVVLSIPCSKSDGVLSCGWIVMCGLQSTPDVAPPW